MKRYFIVLLALQILGCSGAKEDGAPDQSLTTPAVSQKTATNKITITPDNATVRSIITLYANTSLLANATIEWYVNGNIGESSGGHRFASSELVKGDIIQAIVTRNKKEYYSNEIRILNTPPRINSAKMVPALPRVGNTLSIEADAHDVDGDTIYYKYKWILNGKHISDEKYLSTEFKRDDMIVVEVTPYDSDNTGNIIFVKNMIFNTPPAVTENKPSFDGKTYTYNLNASDVDGDDLTYEIKDGPNGMTIDRSGKITWKVGSGDAGTYRYTVLINDNNGGGLVVPINTRIGFEESKQVE